MKRLIALASIAALATTAAAAAPARANTCAATVVEVPGVAYVVLDDALLPDTLSLWIYQESNGEAGLQRADDICPGTNGDTILF